MLEAIFKDIAFFDIKAAIPKGEYVINNQAEIGIKKAYPLFTIRSCLICKGYAFYSIFDIGGQTL